MPHVAVHAPSNELVAFHRSNAVEKVPPQRDSGMHAYSDACKYQDHSDPSSFYEVLDDMPAAEREGMLNGVQHVREVIARAFTRFDLPVAETSRKQVVYFNAGLVSIAFHDLAPGKFQRSYGELPGEEVEALQAYCDEVMKLLERLMREHAVTEGIDGNTLLRRERKEEERHLLHEEELNAFTVLGKYHTYRTYYLKKRNCDDRHSSVQLI